MSEKISLDSSVGDYIFNVPLSDGRGIEFEGVYSRPVAASVMEST